MLTILILLPLIGAGIVGFFPGNIAGEKLRGVALTITAGILLVTLWLAAQFDLTNSGLQFQEYLPWIPQIGLSYKLGTDGLSFPLVALSSLLTGIIIFSARINVERLSLKYALIFLVNGGVVGALLAQNLLLFIIFYELILIPLYLLIAIWGGEKREYAAMKFLIYTAVSGILILAGFLGMTWLSHSNSFDYDRITTQDLPLITQLILLTLLVIGFGIKIPLVPLHTWLPDAYVEASPAVAILLGGMVAKLGTYGLIRFGLQLFPETWALVAPGLSIIGVFSVMYGALAAISQKDIKRMVAYSSIGHMGYIVVAAAALTPLGLLGAVSQMVSHGLILAILFYLVGIIETKVGTRDLDILNGLMNPTRGLPLTSALLILGGMASAGIPGMAGFIAEFLVFQGSYSVFPWQTLLCIFASGLTAVYFVILLNRTCFGKLDNTTAYYPQVKWNEQAPAILLAIIIIFLGIQPTWLIRWTEPTTDAIVAIISTNTERQIALNYQEINEFASDTGKMPVLGKMNLQ